MVHATTRSSTARVLDAERLALSRQILEVVTDGYDLTSLDGNVELTARKVLRGSGVG